MKRGIFVLGLLLPSVAYAQDPKFQFGKAEDAKTSDEKKEVEWNASAEVGAIFTTGNSETTTVTAGAKASRKAGKDKFSGEASVAYARSSVRIGEDTNGTGTIDSLDEIRDETSTTAETFAGKLRYDRFLTEHNSLFAAVLASRDIPAGKESVIGGQLGYSRQLYKTEKSEIVGEFGYDFAREDLVVGDPLAIHSLRVFVGAKAKASEGVEADGSVEMLSNLNSLDLPTGANGDAFRDTRVNGHVGITAKIGKSLAVQSSIDAKFDNRPAPLKIDNLEMGFVPEASNLDMIMKASLIYTFM